MSSQAKQTTNTSLPPSNTANSTFRRPNLPGAEFMPSASGFSPSSSSQDNRKLIVGPEIVLKGEIGACDQLVVEGTVEATIKGGQNLHISQSGLFKGTVEIQDAEIAGRFEGDISVSGRLVVRQTGEIKGTVSYGQMQMDAGAVIEGTISPMSSSLANSRSSKSSSSVSKTPSPANEENDLLQRKSA